MAESVLINFVIGILQDMIENEADLLSGVVGQVKSVQTELVNIKCYLKDADSKRRKGNESVENWLNKLRDVAHRIEDATDTFHLLLEDKRQKNPNVIDKLKNLGLMPMKVPGRRKLAMELADIQNELEEIFRSKARYGIEGLQDENLGSTPGKNILPFRRAAHEDVDETQVVGLDADKNNMLNLLLHHRQTPRRTVITIVGAGGRGKTTLARMVYQSAKDKFSFHIMLSISQQYNLTDLVRKILRKLKDSIPENQDLDDLIYELKSWLKWRKYLIILDDVWETDFWSKIKDALPNNMYGSRVLMTSRSVDVANLADPGMVPYNLALLNDKDSLDLLLKKALPYQKCPSDMLELAKILSKKCKGLPLALIVVGGNLSTKYQSYHAWKRVLDTMNWHQEGKDCMNVLALSYEDMPAYLKTCFLYLGAFPEDYEISAKRLIRMWVAEGFMPWQEMKTMEESAEDCLEQLFQRSMIQVSSRYPNGSIMYCQVHDLLRDLAIHQCRKQNFLTVFRNPEDADHEESAARRASLQFCSPQFMKQVLPTNTRLLLCFGGSLPNYYELRLLRVIEIVDVKMFCSTDLRELDRLIHLRYLGFRNCAKLNMPACSFDRLKNLETLDLRGTQMQQLPKGLWTISSLRHVLYDPYIRGLPSTAELRNLQTLQWVEINSTWQPKQFPNLNNLRELGLTRRDAGWLAVTYLFRTLSSLVSLGIRGSDIPKEIVYPGGIPNYQNIQTLHLEGKWAQSATLAAKSFPRHLVKLTLIGSKLAHDPMLELAKLKSLKELRLGRDAYTGKQMNCPSGFRALRTLVLGVGEYMVLTVAEGAMPKLKYLKCAYSIKLVLPPELNHLTGNEYSQVIPSSD